MARQPWLTRLALGRNAFEPLQESESESEPGSSENHHDDSDEPSRHAQEQNPVESELSDPDQCFTRLQPHVQQYDQRGYPTNPASEAHARQVRRAYNDVLASVGVVKRKDDEKKEAFATATQRAAELTEVENLVGSLVTATSFMGSFFSIWAFKNLRLRLAMFNYYPTTVPILELLRSERQAQGLFTFYLAGMPASLFGATAARVVDIIIDWLGKQFDRLVIATVQSRAARLRYEKLRIFSERLLSLSSSLLLEPVFLYSDLQRLGLIPATLWLPPWRSFVPFSAPSPFHNPNIPSSPNMVSLAAWGSALTTSPMTICFMVYGLYFLREFTAQELPPPAHYPYGDEAPLMFSLDSSNTHASPLRKVGFSSIVRTNIAMPIANLRHFCLAALGYPVTTQRRQLFSSVRTSRVSRNRMPPTLRELSPRSPTSRAFSPNHDHGEDDTISNASSAYTDALASPQGADIEPNDSQHSEARRDVDQDVDRKYHVTELSRAPSALLSFWLDRMIISWLFAPLEHLALRALAGAFLSGGLRTTGSQAQNAKAIVGMVYRPFVGPVFLPIMELVRGEGTLQSLWASGIYLSRLGLCCVAQALVHLEVSNVQWSIVRFIGRRFFNWGRL